MYAYGYIRKASIRFTTKRKEERGRAVYYRYCTRVERKQND